MADLLDDVGTFLISEGLATAETLGYDRMPDLPDTCIAIYEYAGSNGEQQVAGVLRSLQIVVRDPSVKNARMKANAIYRMLDVEDGIVQLTPERWGAINLRQTPFKIKVDDRGRVHYGFNLGINTFSD